MPLLEVCHCEIFINDARMVAMTTQAGHASAAPPWGRGWVPADTFAARLALARMHADNITIRDATTQAYTEVTDRERRLAIQTLPAAA